MYDPSQVGPIPSIEEFGKRITDPVVEGPPDVISGFLPKQGQLVVAGMTNAGKSLIALEACSAFATGTPLWGALQPATQAKKILYVLGEHYDEVIQRLWQHTKLPMTDNVWLLGPERLGADKWLVSGGKQNVNAVNKFKKWAEGADLIVFDPLAAFITGIDVENDNVQMRLLLDTMSSISQSSGASSIVLAHQGKPSMGQNGQEFSRKSYAIRGASGIEDAATNIFYLGESSGESKAANSVPKDFKMYTLTCRKYKGEAPAEYNLVRDPGTLRHTLLGNRPFAEVIKMDRAAKVAKLQGAFPDMKFSDVIRAIATIQDCSEVTIKRDLGMI